MSYSRGEHPASRANLTPFKQGQSGNPGGRRHGAWTPADYLRHLAGSDFTQARLEAVRDDEAEPCGKRAAAALLLRMLSDDATEARRTFESISNRLEGTPTQSHRLIDEATPDPSRVLA